jgi:FHA domain-containing protein
MADVRPSPWVLMIENDERVLVEQHRLVADHYCVGRDASCDVYIGERNVSRRHAELVRDEAGVWSVRDLGSKNSNGTFVNGQRLGPTARALEPGDCLQVGEVLLTMRPEALGTPLPTAFATAGLEEGDRPARLLVVQGPESGREVRLDRGPVTMGGVPDANARLEGEAFAEVAVVVRPLADGRHEVLNRGANKLYLGLQQIEHGLLSDGDLLFIEDAKGEVLLRLRYLGEGQQEPTCPGQPMRLLTLPPLPFGSVLPSSPPPPPASEPDDEPLTSTPLSTGLLAGRSPSSPEVEASSSSPAAEGPPSSPAADGPPSSPPIAGPPSSPRVEAPPSSSVKRASASPAAAGPPSSKRASSSPTSGGPPPSSKGASSSPTAEPPPSARGQNDEDEAVAGLRSPWAFAGKDGQRWGVVLGTVAVVGLAIAGWRAASLSGGGEVGTAGRGAATTAEGVGGVRPPPSVEAKSSETTTGGRVGEAGAGTEVAVVQAGASGQGGGGEGGAGGKARPKVGGRPSAGITAMPGEVDAAVRARLEQRVFGGRATAAEIEALDLICQRQRDRACSERVRTILAKGPPGL